jgi:MoaA/NifB/PqqE/SkfB family radical SAM enzyme
MRQPNLPEARRFGVAVLEVSAECDIKCATCIAGAGPGGGRVRSLKECARLIGEIESQVCFPAVLMISGGEPTVHPQFDAIVDLALASRFSHCVIITNGVRMAEDATLATRLAQYGDRIEVYLQFDSSRGPSLVALRGLDLSEVRRKALWNLEREGISTTLVAVIKRGVNDGEIKEIIQAGLQLQCTRGIIFQPIRSAGRHEIFSKNDSRINLTDIRREVLASEPWITDRDLVFHPENPLGICIGYYKRSESGARAVTEEVLARMKGRGLFFLPLHNHGALSYKGLFRVMIVSYLDDYSFLKEQLNTCNIGVAADTGMLIPIDSYFLEGEASHLVAL